MTAVDLDRIGRASLKELGDIRIDDVLSFIDRGIEKMPSYMDLYRRWEAQQWAVGDLDFTLDRQDWESFSELDRKATLWSHRLFFNGEERVTATLAPFVWAAPTPEIEVFLSTQMVDEARHTVFFDRFYREVVGLKGDDIMDILDASFPWVSETFVAPFGLLAYQADELRLHPYDERARVRYGTNYFLWIEGVLALSVMKVTLSYARWRGFLPAYYTGFTATCRDESRHVQGGMRYLLDAVRKDPTMINEIHDTLRTILSVSGVVSRRIYYEPLGWTDDEVRALFFLQLRRKLNDVGIGLSPDLEDLLEKVQPVLAGG